MDGLRALFEQTAKLAADFYDTLDERPVTPRATAEELRGALARPLPQEPTDASTVIAELAAARHDDHTDATSATARSPARSACSGSGRRRTSSPQMRADGCSPSSSG